MREILFRGKREDNGEWIFGSLHIESGETDRNGNQRLYYRILGKRGECDYVGPETVGQYTGLTDKNGKKIFEGDIIKIPDDYDQTRHNAGEIYEVYFCFGGFRLKPKYSEARGYWLEDDGTVEVIGNIHDNKEWLDEQPTVDAVEVVHGRWELTAHNQIVNGRRSVTAQCSECGEDKGEIWAGFFPGIPDYIADSVALQSAESVKLSNYCPNCGAKMDGGKEK